MTVKDKPLDMMPTATAQRPLAGLTVLVVEDSRFASEALRLLCLRSGARIRRADTLHAAHRHLKVYRPNVVIVDLGLPDGSGTDLIAELNNARPRVDVILGMSGDSGAEPLSEAAGADGFIEKPISNLGAFQECVLSCLPDDFRPSGLHTVNDTDIAPDPETLRDDFTHIAEILTADHGENMLDYIAQFLSGIARSSGDTEMESAAQSLAFDREQGLPFQTALARIENLLRNRIEPRKAG
ncbi:response regulator [Celeribacter litoreus]|uniref:response regulator n=1 Tax=Celeribacter litoreus TaxID=2876714 RepID=UPI001CCA3B6D|nr:response regulator [Celeribacter litoreus]MCA0042803.1 response regulator [Celeribacter litoreus]